MDDAAAARACLGGNSDGFRHFVDRYQSRALAHARILTRNDADAADAAQEAFVDAFRNLRAFDPDRPFYAWFYVLLRNRCFKQRSRRGTRSESGIVTAGIDPGMSEAHVESRSDCRHARLQLMAAPDEEAAQDIAGHENARRHLASCDSCTQWMKNIESLYGRLEPLSYEVLRAMSDLR